MFLEKESYLGINVNVEIPVNRSSPVEYYNADCLDHHSVVETDFVELERHGPSVINPCRFRRVPCPAQEGGNPRVGLVIYELLKARGQLKDCLGLHDLQAILLSNQINRNLLMAIGGYHGVDCLVGWKSVIRLCNKSLMVPVIGREITCFWDKHEVQWVFLHACYMGSGEVILTS